MASSSPSPLEQQEHQAKEAAKEAWLAGLAAAHVQPVKREFLVDVVAKPQEKRERGVNRKRPYDALQEKKKMTTGFLKPKTDDDDELNRVSFDVLKGLRRNKSVLESPQSSPEEGWWKSEDVEPRELRERKVVDFRNKVYVAPLTTVGNLPFRRILVELGADVTCGEMSLTSSLLDGSISEWSHLRRHRSERIFGVQIAPNAADKAERCCELIRDLCDVDFVDLNLGCPIDCVCAKGAGAALTRKVTKVEAVVKACLKTLPRQALTFKVRTGEKAQTAHTLIGHAQSWQYRGRGLEAVFLHGRSRSDRYAKLADWRFIETCASDAQDDFAARLPVIGNGDVLTYEDYLEKRELAPSSEPCAMLARGALIKPWLPTEIKERRTWDISSSERMDLLRKFTAYGLEHWGADDTGVNRTRRFLLEWLSFLHRYTPVGLLERLPQRINHRPPAYVGRDHLETLFASPDASDWIAISEMLLGPVPPDFRFVPKHKSSAYTSSSSGSKSGGGLTTTTAEGDHNNNNNNNGGSRGGGGKNEEWG